MAGSVAGSARQLAAVEEDGQDLGVLLAREREAPGRPLLDALLAARCWGTPEAVGAAGRLLERHAPWGTDLGPGTDFLVGAPSAHQAALFLDWLQGGKDRTLEAIGRPRGMNAPAVGDAVGRAGRRMRAVLEEAPPPWPWLVAELRRRLGSATTEDRLAAPLDRLGAARGSLPAALAAWLAGPYVPVRGRAGWLARDPGSLLARSARVLRADGGVRRLADVAGELADLDLADGMLVPWLQAFGAVVVHDLAVATAGPLAEAVERVLDAYGTPRTAAQIAEDLVIGGRIVPEGSLAAAVRGRRFRTGTDGGVRLAAWGEPEASGPVRARVRRQGRARSRAAGPFGSADRSDGSPPGGDPVPPRRHPGAQPGGGTARQGGAASRDGAGPLAPAVQEQLWLWVRVDDAVLRGEEAVVPLELVDGLALGVHGRRTFSSRWGPVTLAYEGPQPTRGSLRAVARAVGAQMGDTLLLGFSPAGELAVELRGVSHPGPARPAGSVAIGDAEGALLLPSETGDAIVHGEGDRATWGDGGQAQTLFPLPGTISDTNSDTNSQGAR